MGGRVFFLVLGSAVIGLCLGCRQDDELDRLIQESPFQNIPSEATDDLLIVTCQYLPLQLPGHVDVTQWPFWEKYDALAGGTDLSRPVGFSAEQLRLWRENGCFVAVAPSTTWVELREQLQRVGGKTLAQTTALIRHPAEEVQFLAGWIFQPDSIYLWEGAATGRALTLPAGHCLFNVNCIPGLGGAQAKVFHLKIVPEVQAADPQDHFGTDEFGVLRRIRENPKIVFTRLALSGTLPIHHFVAIASRPDPQMAGKLGRLFFRRAEPEQNQQIIVLLLPMLQTGAQIKAQPGL
ncbi:MAG: hypothetical protein JW810_05270 [Sedimentisphaerales bacterium]|nr:hypothetical protein [Sedimentisphaerales bacterium]